MKTRKRDFVETAIEDYFYSNKNYDLDSIKKYFDENVGISLEIESLRKRIEKIKNENQGFHNK
jgi:hypothetical protein